MNSHRRGGGALSLKAVALLLGGWVVFDSTVVADDGVVVTDHALNAQNAKKGHHDDSNTGSGTLGYGAPGVYPGFQGFGLGYHLGYGYGGAALGVGADGGYPFYGGPGYPHPEPTLRRIGGITPFVHYAGPGYPTPDQPNFFGGVGPLVSKQQVVTIAADAGGSIGSVDYGLFTGGVADPEAQFAPFTKRAAAGASRMEEGSSYPIAIPPNPATTTPVPPAATPVTSPPGPGLGDSTPSSPPRPGGIPNLLVSSSSRSLGIEEESVVDANGVRGVKVSNVHSGAAAEKAGLHAGDLIYSINGYVTQVPGNLAWIISHASPNRVLTMRVRSANDGKEHTITARLF